MDCISTFRSSAPECPSLAVYREARGGLHHVRSANFALRFLTCSLQGGEGWIASAAATWFCDISGAGGGGYHRTGA